MKPSTIFLIGFIGVLIGGIAYSSVVAEVDHYKKEESSIIEKIIEVEKEVPSFEVRIKDAQDAERSRIEDEAQNAYDLKYQAEMDEIEAQVWAEIESEANAKKIEAEKRSGAY